MVSGVVMPRVGGVKYLNRQGGRHEYLLQRLRLGHANGIHFFFNNFGNLKAEEI